MGKIYTDTNVLRYFARAFAEATLPMDLRNELLLAPLSVMELLSQLGTDNAEDAYAAVHALLHFQNAERTGMLPWPDDLFRIAVFGLPPREDTITLALNTAVMNVLNADSPEDLRKDGEELRALMDATKEQTARQFSDVLNGWRSEGPLPEPENRAIFARSIARRAGADEGSVNVDAVVDRLNALYVFESTKMKTAAEHADYNVQKHSNDVYDAELLIYLAHPTLNLLTSDRGFQRVRGSSQSGRVRIIEDIQRLQDPAAAEQIIRDIVRG